MAEGDFVSLQVLTDIHTTWKDFLQLDHNFFNDQTDNISFPYRGNYLNRLY